MTIRSRKTKLVILAIIALLLIFIPLPIRQRHIDKAVGHSLKALIGDRRVIVLNRGYIPLYDSVYYNEDKRLYYDNDIAADTCVYSDAGFEPWPQDPNYHLDYAKEAAVQFTRFSVVGNERPSSAIHFNYYHGMLAAQGYRLIIFRNIFGTFTFYVHEWVS